MSSLLTTAPKWVRWQEPNGRNALHYLGGVTPGDDADRAARSVAILDLLLSHGMDVNAVHEIPDDGATFPATPLWYAYAKGRNRALYTALLERGADTENCMFAIAWNDDVAAAELFQRHGATIDPFHGSETPFMAAYLWRRFAVARWFLEQGARVDATDAAGNTALYFAIKRRYDVEQVELLLRHGADPDHSNAAGETPRSLAEANRQRKLLAMLDRAASR